MTRLLGVRHGEVHNPENVIYAGLAGYGLSELGRDQARRVAEALTSRDVAAIYASPLDRAVETASWIAKASGVSVTTDERLYEWRYWSRWAGLTWDELRTNARDDWLAYRNDPGSVTAGESLAELADRMLGFIDDVEAAHPGALVVAVTHLEPLRAAILRMTDRPAGDLFEIQIGLGHVVRLRPDPDPAPLDLTAI